MDEWESDSDSEERDGGDYLEEQDQEGEELDSFYEAGQRDHLVLGQILCHSRNSAAKLLAICRIYNIFTSKFFKLRVINFLCAHPAKLE